MQSSGENKSRECGLMSLSPSLQAKRSNDGERFEFGAECFNTDVLAKARTIITGHRSCEERLPASAEDRFRYESRPPCAIVHWAGTTMMFDN
jgi:hypothetical protein